MDLAGLAHYVVDGGLRPPSLVHETVNDLSTEEILEMLGSDDPPAVFTRRALAQELAHRIDAINDARLAVAEARTTALKGAWALNRSIDLPQAAHAA